MIDLLFAHEHRKLDAAWEVRTLVVGSCGFDDCLAQAVFLHQEPGGLHFRKFRHRAQPQLAPGQRADAGRNVRPFARNVGADPDWLRHAKAGRSATGQGRDFPPCRAAPTRDATASDARDAARGHRAPPLGAHKNGGALLRDAGPREPGGGGNKRVYACKRVPM